MTNTKYESVMDSTHAQVQALTQQVADLIRQVTALTDAITRIGTTTTAGTPSSSATNFIPQNRQKPHNSADQDANGPIKIDLKGTERIKSFDGTSSMYAAWKERTAEHLCKG